MKSMDPLRYLRELVKQYGSQKAVADRLGVSQPYITDLMKGRRPFSDQMLKRMGLERKASIVEAK